MDNPGQAPQSRIRSMSAEAIVGTGVTVGALGLLCLLLGLAQAMRHVHPASWILLAIGAVLVVVGAVVAALARKDGRTRKDSVDSVAASVSPGN